MRYRAKEVSRITGIPVDTLRYFEKTGVISPKSIRTIIIGTTVPGISTFCLSISITEN